MVLSFDRKGVKMGRNFLSLSSKCIHFSRIFSYLLVLVLFTLFGLPKVVDADLVNFSNILPVKALLSVNNENGLAP